MCFVHLTSECCITLESVGFIYISEAVNLASYTPLDVVYKPLKSLSVGGNIIEGSSCIFHVAL